MRALAALLGPLALLAAPLWAFTVDDLTAIHDARDEPYTLNSWTIDADWREAVAEDMRWRDPEIVDEVMAAAAGPFHGTTIHVYNQADTSLVSYIAALEVDGEVVLIAWHSTAFFEIPELVERRVALLDAVLQAFAPARFGPGWAETTVGAAIQGVHDYHDGVRDGPYPGWAYENAGGIQSLGQSVIPDWVAITVTTLDCPPRYPEQGWAVLFLCAAP